MYLSKAPFKISSYFQELITYIGQETTYEKGEEIIKKFLGVEVSPNLINEVTNYYGAECSKNDYLLEPTIQNITVENKLYIGVDGSMLFTRDGGWREAKLMRIFSEKSFMDLPDKQSYLKDSQYIGHLGSSQEFCKKAEDLLDNYKSKFKLQNESFIFLSDGATWIKNWIQDAYPNATHILDFYHVSEYIHNFQKLYINTEKEGKEWVEKQKTLLKESKVEEVINNLKNYHQKNPKKEAQKIINYITENRSRMDYLKYSKTGLGIIGSGAIESSHRTLFQKRMKLSGQKWSIKGLQNMIDLKTVNLNKTWSRIIELTKISKLAA